MINNISSEPLKVRNWNNDNEETRIDYTLSIFEGAHWIQLGFEFTQNGDVRQIEKYNCRMP